MTIKNKAVKVFKAKKEVTKKDAQKLKPLTRYWSNRMSRDNWFVLLFGVFLGFVLGVISNLWRV